MKACLDDPLLTGQFVSKAGALLPRIQKSKIISASIDITQQLLRAFIEVNSDLEKVGVVGLGWILQQPPADTNMMLLRNLIEWISPRVDYLHLLLWCVCYFSIQAHTLIAFLARGWSVSPKLTRKRMTSSCRRRLIFLIQ